MRNPDLLPSTIWSPELSVKIRLLIVLVTTSHLRFHLLMVWKPLLHVSLQFQWDPWDLICAKSTIELHISSQSNSPFLPYNIRHHFFHHLLKPGNWRSFSSPSFIPPVRADFESIDRQFYLVNHYQVCYFFFLAMSSELDLWFCPFKIIQHL